MKHWRGKLKVECGIRESPPNGAGECREGNQNYRLG